MVVICPSVFFRRDVGDTARRTQGAFSQEKCGRARLSRGSPKAITLILLKVRDSRRRRQWMTAYSPCPIGSPSNSLSPSLRVPGDRDRVFRGIAITGSDGVIARSDAS